MTQLAVMGQQEVNLWRNPETVLAEAKDAATALVKVVNLKKNKVVFNGETYLEFEDWQVVSRFYGCTTKIVSTNLVEFDGVRGFEATAVVINHEQAEIGRVDSMCLSDEKNWSDVPEYEWVNELDANGKKIWVEGKNGKKGYYKGEKKEIGRNPKPLFQLRSMAQTRAQVKALRSIFSWVVVMAGYQPTPAEELTGNEFNDDGPPEDEPRQQVTMPKAKTEAQPEQHKTTLFEAKETITARSPQLSKEGALWITFGEKVAVIQPDHVSLHKYNVGDWMDFTAIEKQGKEKKFWIIQQIVSYKENVDDPLPPMDDPLPKKEPDEIDKAIAEGAFDDKEPLGTLQETRKGVMGKNRQTRLQILQRQNEAKTGLTRDILHQILDRMDPPVKHLEDLDVGMFKTWEQIMKGEMDWRPFLED